MSQTEKQATLLKQGLDQLGLVLSEQTQVRLLDYLQLLAKWNKAYNLTAIRDPEEMVVQHLLDSLALTPVIRSYTNASVLDVGTGAGLPGIPLSMVCPDVHFSLLDSNGKKTRFLIQAKAELELKNCSVINDRVEQVQPEKPFDTITARAFSSLTDLVEGCRHLWSDTGHILAMKGVYPESEIAALPADIDVKKVISSPVPFMDGERHVVVLARKANNEVKN